MPTLVVRYRVTDEGVAPVVSAIEEAFAALARERPEGVRFSYYRLAGDSVEFLALLELDEGVENPLPAIEATRALQATVAKWAEGEQPPIPQPLQLLGSYGSSR